MTPLQERFVAEYLIDLDPAQAALRAGYKPRAAARARTLLVRPEIRDAVSAAKEKRARRVEVAADRVVGELAAIAFASSSDFFEWDADGVRLKPSAALSETGRRAIAEVTENRTERTTTVRIKLHDKIAALDRLARHLGIFQDRGDGDTRDSFDKEAAAGEIERRLARLAAREREA